MSFSIYQWFKAVVEGRWASCGVWVGWVRGRWGERERQATVRDEAAALQDT